MGGSDVHIDIFYPYFNRYIDIRVKFLKAIILKTTQSSSMKLKSLGVEHHGFVLGPIS